LEIFCNTGKSNKFEASDIRELNTLFTRPNKCGEEEKIEKDVIASIGVLEETKN
jgi:hypothetical protein